MTIQLLREFLGWCAVINYSVLMVWFLFIMFAHDWVHRLHGQWFRIPAEQFDAIHYTAMAYYKIGIFLLILAPYVALVIMGRGGRSL